MNWERVNNPTIAYPLWLRLASGATVGSVFLLLLIGTLVTTFGVGMADTVWPTPPWYLLFHDRSGDFGWYVEHAHRVAGYVVGLMVLVTSLAFWIYNPHRSRRILAVIAIASVVTGTGVGMYQVRHAPDKSFAALANMGFALAGGATLIAAGLVLAEWRSRVVGRWHRVFALVALWGVIIQGLLGGLRVYLNELRGPELAIVHGLFAQIVAATVTALTLMTGTRWNQLTDLVVATRIRVIAVALIGLLLVQIGFGGVFRHVDAIWGRRLHPMLGIAALSLCGFLVWETNRSPANASLLRRKAFGLLATMLVQALLGIEAFVRVTEAAATHRGVTPWDALWQSLHVWVGFGVFTMAALFAARAWKAWLI
jgi:heme A synthase